MEPNQQDILARTRTQLAAERNLLAAERTFSAWIRTGLAGIGGGFAMIRLISFQSSLHQSIGIITGECFIVWGMGVFIFALLRYFKSVKKLERTIEYPVSLYGTTIIVLSLVALSLFLMFIAV